MKRVLLLTNIYPNNDPKYTGTAVCHSFTKEWLAMGYDVRVIHFESLFPRPYYWVGRVFNERIKAKTGAVAYTNVPRKFTEYNVDGVPVMMMPLKKYVPHKAPSPAVAKKAFNILVKSLAEDGFVPDVITAHFILPQLQFLHLFKAQFPKATTCLVLHGNSEMMEQFYPQDYKEFMQSVDIWGFRSLAFQTNFEDRYGKTKKMFLCHSGIPEKYIEAIDKNFDKGVHRFVFVGSLLELKNVDITIRALHQALQGYNYSFDIVGSGAEGEKLHSLVNELGMEKNVVFHGQLKRDDAQKIVREADCLIMVSSREAFGLVYIEAMAKGCIVVGTEGQGIDGIVKHGENGYLCKSRDVDGLAKIIKGIVSLPSSSLKQISQMAVQTAINMTDRKVAERYINVFENNK